MLYEVLIIQPTLPPVTSPLLRRPILYPLCMPSLFPYAAATAAAATQGRMGPPVGISGKARLGHGDPCQVRRSSSEVGARRRGQLGETSVGQ